MILRRRSRPKDDQIVFAVVSKAIKKKHQNYLAAGGLYAWSAASRRATRGYCVTGITALTRSDR